MAIRKKTNEKLIEQGKGFFDYFESTDKITKEKKDGILRVISGENIRLLDKESIKEQLVGVLSDVEFENLYNEYENYYTDEFKERKRILKGYLKGLFPEGYEFLLNHFIIRFLVEQGKEDIENYKLPEEEIKKYRNIADGNIKILEETGIKKTHLGRFLDIIFSDDVDVVRDNIKTLISVGITEEDDLFEMQDVITDSNSDKIKKNVMDLYNAGITNPKDLVKLRYLIKNIVGRKLELFCDIGKDYYTVDDFLKLGNLMSEGYADRIKIFGNLGIKDVDDFLKLSKIICKYGDTTTELIELFCSLGIEKVDDFCELEEVILNGHYSAVFENIDTLQGTGLVKEASDWIKLKDIIKYPFTGVVSRNIKMLQVLIISTVDELIKLKNFIFCGRGARESLELENKLTALANGGINTVDDCVKLEKIIFEGNCETINILVGAGITEADELLKLEKFICNPVMRGNLRTLVNAGITEADELLKLSDIIYSDKIKNIKDNVEMLVGVGINKSDEFLKLKDIIFGIIFKENLETLVKIGIGTVDELVKLKNLLGDQDFKAKAVEALSTIGINIADDLNKLYNFCTSNSTVGIIKKLKYGGISTQNLEHDRLMEILEKIYKQNLNFSNWNFFSFIDDFGDLIDDNDKKILLELKEIWSEEYCNNRVENNLLFLYSRGFSVEEINNFRGLYGVEENIEVMLAERPEITIEELNLIVGVLENGKTENLKFILEKRPEITIEELNLIVGVLWSARMENLKEIFNKYPELLVEEILDLKDIFEAAKIENLKIILKQFSWLSIEDIKKLDALKPVLLYANVENLKIIFDKYPEITIKDVCRLSSSSDYSRDSSSLSLLASSLTINNFATIGEHYLKLSLEDLITIQRLVASSQTDNLKLILEKQPEITKEKLNDIVLVLKKTKTGNLRLMLENRRVVTNEQLKGIVGVLENAKTENLELILGKYPEITKEELTTMEEMLCEAKTENLELILGKYPEITKEELTTMEEMLCEAKTENLKLILEKYPEITKEEVIDDNMILIIKKAQIDNLRLILQKLSEITKGELSTIQGVVVSSQVNNLKLILDKYPEITIKELNSLEEILKSAEVNNLKMIFGKYPGITVQQLIPLQEITGTKANAFLHEIKNFGGSLPTLESINILDLMRDTTTKHKENFMAIENINEINDRNWINVSSLYSAIEYFEDDRHIPDEITVPIKALFTDAKNKDIIYKKLYDLLEIVLLGDEELTNEEIALLAVINKKGLFNMGQSESLAKFIYQINKLDKNYKFKGVLNIVKQNIKAFLKNHKNDLNEFMNPFFEISTSILEKSPAIYSQILALLIKLKSKDQEMFYREVFPLYYVELFLGEELNNSVKGQLISMKESIKGVLNDIDSGESIDKVSLKEKKRLQGKITQSFKEKFGIKKIPLEFTKENMESIKWHSIYLSNMNDRDKAKETILGYFLALKLDGKRISFRAGEYFDPDDYMDESRINIVKEYLLKRGERDGISKLEHIEEKDKKLLQENESNIIIGNTNGIIERLKTIENNVRSLIDDDVYSNRERIIKKYIEEYGEKYGSNKYLGTLLSKQFKSLSNKCVLSEEERGNLLKFCEELGDDMNSKDKILELQKEVKSISSIVNFVNNIIHEDVVNKIQKFDKICEPSEECLGLLNKIGINLEDGRIVSSNAFLVFIESGIVKGKGKLEEEEYKILHDYILNVRKELDNLYGIKRRLAVLYEDLGKKVIDKYFVNTQLRQRFEEMSPYFFTKADSEKENIVSLMTNDMDIVIKNIRQCLGCRHKGCNNDTDLSFGCDDRFFITTSHREGDGSFADELVTLLPRFPSEEGFTFVMDMIYGNNGSTDILLNNIYVLLKKINNLSSNLQKKISILVPSKIGLTLDEEGIARLKKLYRGISINYEEITLTVESQPIGDSYHEFGGLKGGCRSVGDAKLSGYLIKFE